MDKQRAVAYIRVSTSSDSQLHSYEYQVDYWNNYLINKEDIALVKIYADRGISGRSLYKRPELLKLLEDAKNNKFDVIYTKSISRFSRNTLDMLNMVRYLRDLNIKVIFENENIDTFDPSMELFLTIAGAVAENDLRIYAENQRWAIREKFKNGVVVIGNKILGYDMDKNTNTLIINKEESKTIKRIFELYLSGLGLSPVAKRLEQEGVKNIHGTTKWSEGSINYILRNEKYKGCSLNQKTVKIDGVEKKNTSLAKKYYMEDVHEAIIDKKTFDEVQLEIERRASVKLKGKGANEVYPFTGIIECGDCKKRYTHKYNNPNKKWRTAIWCCYNQNRFGKKYCKSTMIKDEVLKEKFIESYNEFIKRINEVESIIKLKEKRRELIESENELNSLRLNRKIFETDYIKELKSIKVKITEINSKIANQEIEKDDLNEMTFFDETKVKKYIEKIIINYYKIKFIYKNGIETIHEYTNGPSGNKKRME